MKKWFLATLAVAALAAGLAASIPARSAQAVVSGDGVPGTCSLPAADRTGNWSCPKPGTAKLARQAFVAAHPGVSYTEHCHWEGCWYRFTSYKAEWQGNISYGFGSKYLGDMRTYALVTLSGNTTTVRAWQRSTRGTTRDVISGQRLKAALSSTSGSCREGCAITSTYRQTRISGLHAANYQFAWPSPYYKGYYKSTYASTAIEWNWSDPSSAYPGYWYWWAKAPKSHITSGIPKFMSVGSLPASWVRTGWRR